MTTDRDLLGELSAYAAEFMVECVGSLWVGNVSVDFEAYSLNIYKYHR